MGFSDLPADTDAERIIMALDQMSDRLDTFAEAINGLGMNVQWIVDNVKGLFEMFGNPQFMAMLPKMINPAGMQDAATAMKGADANGGRDADAASGE